MIEDHMPALVKKSHGIGGLELVEAPVPRITADEVLIKVHACGICGSDLKIEDDEHPYTPPVIIGHEFSGEIVATGNQVTGWKIGDRVVSEQHVGACRRCDQCLTGNAFACPKKRSPGYFTDGAFAKYMKVPDWLLHRIPDSISFIEASFCEPTAVAVHGILERTGIRPEDTVVILGCGPIGLVGARMAQVAGASQVVITGIDRDEKFRLQKAVDLGIDYAVNVAKQDLETIVADITKGKGADVVIELSGAPSAIHQAFSLVRRNGKMGIIGQPPSDDINIPYRQAMFRALKVVFSYSSKFSSWERTLSMFGRRIINPGDFITHVLPLEKWESGFELSRSGEALKVVLVP